MNGLKHPKISSNGLKKKGKKIQKLKLMVKYHLLVIISVE